MLPIKEPFDIIEEIRKKWEYPHAIWLLEGLILVLGFVIYTKTPDSYMYVLCFIPILMIVASAWWLYSNKIEKVKIGKIGVYISILSEKDEERNRIKKDFLNGLERQIEKLGVFQIILAKQYQTEQFKKLAKREEKLLRFFRKKNIGIAIWGDCCTRAENGQKYYIELKSCAASVLADTDKRKTLFSRDLSSSFKREHLVDRENEISGFKVTSSNVAYSTKFVAGIICLVSGKYENAFNIHYDLKNEIGPLVVDGLQDESEKKLAYMNRRLPILCIESALGIIIDIYAVQPVKYEKAKKYIDFILDLRPDNYSAILCYAIYLFKIEKNIELAKKELYKLKKSDRGEWLYSLAFLYSYEGRLDESYKCYNKAFNREIYKHIVLSVEVFIDNELKDNPDLFQLHYNLGLINYKKKMDYALAKEHFECFIENAEKNSKFMSHINYAKQYLAKINDEISKI